MESITKELSEVLRANASTKLEVNEIGFAESYFAFANTQAEISVLSGVLLRQGAKSCYLPMEQKIIIILVLLQRCERYTTRRSTDWRRKSWTCKISL